MNWVINRWYRQRNGLVGKCCRTDGVFYWYVYRQPIVILSDAGYSTYCVGGEFLEPGLDTPYDIVAGPFETEEEAWSK